MTCTCGAGHTAIETIVGDDGALYLRRSESLPCPKFIRQIREARWARRIATVKEPTEQPEEKAA